MKDSWKTYQKDAFTAETQKSNIEVRKNNVLETETISKDVNLSNEQFVSVTHLLI